jgi:hypothetical protein
VTAWTPLDDPRIEALVSWSVGDERPDVPAALASLADAPPRPECAVALGGVAAKAYERLPGVGARDERLGHAVVAVLGGLAQPARPSSSAFRTAPATSVRARRSGRPSTLLDATPRADRARRQSARSTSLGCACPSGRSRRCSRRPPTCGVRTAWLGADARASKPAAAARASAGEHACLAAERKRLQAGLTSLRAELDVELLRGTPVTLEQWVVRWFSDPLRSAAVRRMIWAFDDVPALPTEDGLRDVGGEPVEAPATALVALQRRLGGTRVPSTGGKWFRAERLRLTDVNGVPLDLRVYVTPAGGDVNLPGWPGALVVGVERDTDGTLAATDSPAVTAAGVSPQKDLGGYRLHRQLWPVEQLDGGVDEVVETVVAGAGATGLLRPSR